MTDNHLSDVKRCVPLIKISRPPPCEVAGNVDVDAELAKMEKVRAQKAGAAEKLTREMADTEKCG